MEILYRVVGAVRYLGTNGILLSSEGLRKASDRQEIIPMRTEDGIRVFTQTILDEFIAQRRAKQEAKTQVA